MRFKFIRVFIFIISCFLIFGFLLMISLKSQDNNNYSEVLGMEPQNYFKIDSKMHDQDNRVFQKKKINDLNFKAEVLKISKLDSSLKDHLIIDKSIQLITPHREHSLYNINQDRFNHLNRTNILNINSKKLISYTVHDSKNVRPFGPISHQHLNFGKGKVGIKDDNIFLKHQMKIDSILSQNKTIKKIRKVRYSFQQIRKLVSPVWALDLMYDKKNPPDMFIKWKRGAEVFCENKFIAYDNDLAKFKDLEINRKFCVCKLKGGEMIRDVINQSEDDEYYNLEMGCFRLSCNSRPTYLFNAKSHLNKWMYALATLPDSEHFGQVFVWHQFTIAIVRYEYANFYHTMTDWYNAYLTMQFFNKTSSNTNILIVDAHPHGSLDYVWTNLFNSTFRLSSLPPRTRFSEIVWGIVGYNSLLKTTISTKPPLFTEFRQFFLNSFAILKIDEPINCMQLKILFIWRRDYLAHPRNPKGSVNRQILNEKELVLATKTTFPNAIISESQIDLFEMRVQLSMIIDSDIIVGMHGAGLTHAIFMRKGTALIELVPSYWSPMEHFEAISQWRGINYFRWKNTNTTIDLDNKNTIVPVQDIINLLSNSINLLC